MTMSMKSKLTTYLLIAVVLVVWGIILKKMFFSRPDPVTPPLSSVRPTAAKEAPESLSLDYRDPFRPKPSPKPAVAATVPEQQKKAPEKVNMKFIGRLECGKTVNYIVELEGNMHTLAHKEEAEGFQLVRVFTDSLHFRKNGETYTLLIE